MHIERHDNHTRTITVHVDEAVMIFHKDGVTYDGPNPMALAKNPKVFEEFLEKAPHLANWFDCAEIVYRRTTEGDGEPWDLHDDFDARN